MTYSKELIKKCKEVYPNYNALNNLAVQGHPILGRYLSDNVETISYEDVLDPKEDINIKAERIKAQHELKLMFINETR